MTWFVGALLIDLVIPVTFLIIMLKNKQLLILGHNIQSYETQVFLLDRWVKFYSIRGILSCIASIIYVT